MEVCMDPVKWVLWLPSGPGLWGVSRSWTNEAMGQLEARKWRKGAHHGNKHCSGELSG